MNIEKLQSRHHRMYTFSLIPIQDIIVYSTSRLKLIINQWKEKEEIIVSRERVNAFKQWMDR